MLLNYGVEEDSWQSLGLPRRSNQSILKEISPEYSLEGLMLKLKLHYFVHLMWRTDSLEKTLMLGNAEARRRRGRQRMKWLDGIADLMDVSLSKLRNWWWTGKPGVLQSTGSQRVGHNWVTELNWTEYMRKYFKSWKLMYWLNVLIYYFNSTKSTSIIWRARGSEGLAKVSFIPYTKKLSIYFHPVWIYYFTWLI